MRESEIGSYTNKIKLFLTVLEEGNLLLTADFVPRKADDLLA